MVEMARIVEVAEASGNDSRLAHAYYMHSVAASSTGDFDEAHRLIARARAAARRTGSPTDLASAFVAEASPHPTTPSRWTRSPLPTGRHAPLATVG